jgi:hypothetical protein
MHRKTTNQYKRRSSKLSSYRRQFTAPSSKGMPNLNSTATALGRQRQFTAPSSKGMPNLDSTATATATATVLGRQRQFTAPSSKGMPNLDSTATATATATALGRRRQFTAPSSKGMPNLDLTATATALDCQRQFTARSSKGMSMDPAAPERTLSSHIDADCDNAPNNSFMNLEDLNGFHDCIIRSNRQRQTHASSANTFLTPCMCHSTDLDYANLLSGTTPVDQPSYYKTTHDANHRSSPIFFNPSSRCTTTFPSVSANQLNNSDLLLHQHQTIAPTAERRDEHNYQMSFSDSAHAGSNTKELCTSGLDTPQPIRRRPSKSKSKKHRQKHRLKSPPPVSVAAAPANVVSTFVRTPRSTTKHQQRSTTKHQQRSITNQQQRSITNQQQRSTTKHQQRSITNHQQRSITNHQQRSITNHQQRSITNHRRSLSSRVMQTTPSYCCINVPISNLLSNDAIDTTTK